MLRAAWLAIGLTALASSAVIAPTSAARAAPAKAVPAKAVPAQTDTGFAGYQVSKPKTHVKSATASFVVPTITCKKNASGVGPAALVDSTVNKKTNTFTYSGAAVGVGCENKQPAYESIIIVDNVNFNDFPVAAGDRVVLSVHMSKSGTTASFDDVTSGAHKTRTGKGAIGASARVGASSLQINNVGVGLDPFTTIAGSKVEINGKPIANEKPMRFTWVRHRTVLVAASALSKGKDFTLTFKHS
jgi:hypothetical protein